MFVYIDSGFRLYITSLAKLDRGLPNEVLVSGEVWVLALYSEFRIMLNFEDVRQTDGLHDSRNLMKPIIATAQDL
tara:strand:- start:289 stop:513 length:225 start_codon:yes stop_codon:yes gene_type:complete